MQITLVHFPSYYQIVLNNIEGCITDEQLMCCNNLINHFKQLFTGVKPQPQLDAACNELWEAYRNKETRI